MLDTWKKSYDKPKQCIKKQRHHFANKGPYSQGYGLPSSHVQMWELDHKEGRAPKNLCFPTVVLEKTPERPLDCREVKAVNPKWNQPWIFIGRTDAKASVLWSPDANSWLFGKDYDAEKNWRLKEKWVIEDKMVDGITDSMDGNLGKLREMLRNREAWHAAVHWVTRSQMWLDDWATATTTTRNK